MRLTRSVSGYHQTDGRVGASVLLLSPTPPMLTPRSLPNFEIERRAAPPSKNPDAPHVPTALNPRDSF